MFVQYPTGLRITFVSSKPTTEPESEREGGNKLSPSKRLIRVTLRVSNSSGTAVPVNASYSPPFTLYEGPNLAKVDSFAEYGGDSLTSSNNETVVGPHSSFTVFDSFAVTPGDALAVQTEPGYFGQNLTPYVFYGFNAPR